jgi:hypothetical protein
LANGSNKITYEFYINVTYIGSDAPVLSGGGAGYTACYTGNEDLLTIQSLGVPTDVVLIYDQVK